MVDEFAKVMADYGLIHESYGIFKCSQQVNDSRHLIHGSLESHAIYLQDKLQQFRKDYKAHLFLVAHNLNEIDRAIAPYLESDNNPKEGSIDSCCCD